MYRGQLIFSRIPSEPASFGRKFRPSSKAFPANLFLLNKNDIYLCKNPSEVYNTNRELENTHVDELFYDQWNDTSLILSSDDILSQHTTNEIKSASNAEKRIRDLEGDENRVGAYPIAILVQEGFCSNEEKVRNARKINDLFASYIESGGPRIEYLIMHKNLLNVDKTYQVDEPPNDPEDDIGVVILDYSDGLNLRQEMFIKNMMHINVKGNMVLNSAAFLPWHDETRNLWRFLVFLDGISKSRTQRQTRFMNTLRLVFVVTAASVLIFRCLFKWYMAGARFRWRRNNRGRIIGITLRRPSSFFATTNQTASSEGKSDWKLTEEQVKALPEIEFGGGESMTPVKCYQASAACVTNNINVGACINDHKADSIEKIKPDSEAYATGKNGTTSNGNDKGLQNKDSEITLVTHAQDSSNSSISLEDDLGVMPCRMHPPSSINIVTASCTLCSICIDEFEKGEMVRLLPRCGHIYHTECIMPWLTGKRACCPLCKKGILDEEEEDKEPITGLTDTNSIRNIVSDDEGDIESGDTHSTQNNTNNQ